MMTCQSIWPASASVCAALLYSQSMTHGVWPEAIVAGVGSTGRRLPASLSSLKKSTPGPMSSAEPPLASEAMTTPLNPAAAAVGSPFSAILPSYSGLRRSATVAGMVTFPASHPIDM
jgi:hypothetical protein